jgi:hypothetical protein
MVMSLNINQQRLQNKLKRKLYESLNSCGFAEDSSEFFYNEEPESTEPKEKAEKGGSSLESKANTAGAKNVSDDGDCFYAEFDDADAMSSFIDSLEDSDGVNSYMVNKGELFTCLYVGSQPNIDDSLNDEPVEDEPAEDETDSEEETKEESVEEDEEDHFMKNETKCDVSKPVTEEEDEDADEDNKPMSAERISEFKKQIQSSMKKDSPKA